jgi:hypothetical protein
MEFARLYLGLCARDVLGLGERQEIAQFGGIDDFLP